MVNLVTQKNLKLSKPRHTAWRRFRQGTAGLSAVEAALILPVFLLLVCGIADFGNIYCNMNMANAAAGSGAIYARAQTANNGAAPTATALQTLVRGWYQNNNLLVTMPATTPQTTPPTMTVVVRVPVSIITPLISPFFQNNQFNVTGQCVVQAQSN